MCVLLRGFSLCSFPFGVWQHIKRRLDHSLCSQCSHLAPEKEKNGKRNGKKKKLQRAAVCVCVCASIERGKTFDNQRRLRRRSRLKQESVKRRIANVPSGSTSPKDKDGNRNETEKGEARRARQPFDFCSSVKNGTRQRKKVE